MNQHDLNRAVAQATGESVATVAALGFGLLMPPTHPDPERRCSRRRKIPLSLIRKPREKALRKRRELKPPAHPQTA